MGSCWPGNGVRILTSTTETRRAEPIDTSVRLVTPERVEFRYTLAGPFRRSMSYLLDQLVLALVAFAGLVLTAIFSVAFSTVAGIGPFLALYFVLTWGYGAFCEGVFNGRTIGKVALGIRVVTEEGVPITGTQAALRNLVGAADGAIPFLYLTGLASMVLTAKFQRLGDLAAGTMVIVEEPRSGPKIPRVESSDVADVLGLLPLRVSAGSETSRALSDYVRHRKRFGRDRREEIAGHLARPLRQRYSLPPGASADAILCAFYHRLFLGE